MQTTSINVLENTSDIEIVRVVFKAARPENDPPGGVDYCQFTSAAYFMWLLPYLVAMQNRRLLNNLGRLVAHTTIEFRCGRNLVDAWYAFAETLCSRKKTVTDWKEESPQCWQADAELLITLEETATFVLNLSKNDRRILASLDRLKQVRASLGEHILSSD